MSKHYLQEKIIGTQGQVVGFDASGNAVAQEAPQTGYTKEETLTGATAALFGLGASAVPNDVFSWLGKYNEHWWSATTISWYTEESALLSYLTVASSTAQTITYSATVSTDSSGNIVMNNPQTITIAADQTGVTALLNLVPCYIKGLYDDNQGVYYLPVGIQAGKNTTYGISYGTGGVRLQPNASIGVSAVKIVAKYGEYTEYVFSANRNAYPDDGNVGSVHYKYIGKPFDKFPKMHQVEFGSYLGTGTYGAANPCSISVGFIPRVVIMLESEISNGSHQFFLGGGSTDMNCVLLCDDLTTSDKAGVGFAASNITSNINRMYARKSADGKTIYWYNTSSAVSQMNDSTSSKKYKWVAFG